jgi:hypothetical protein
LSDAVTRQAKLNHDHHDYYSVIELLLKHGYRGNRTMFATAESDSHLANLLVKYKHPLPDSRSSGRRRRRQILQTIRERQTESEV